MGIIDVISGSRLYLDTNIFIYALEAYPEYQSFLTILFASIDTGQYTAITSELTLAEVLIKPMMNNNQDIQQIYEETIQSSLSLTVVPIDRQTLVEAARIRAESDAIHLPDAIHLATARIHCCSSFLTNDKRLKAFSGISICIISDVVD